MITCIRFSLISLIKYYGRIFNKKLHNIKRTIQYFIHSKKLPMFLNRFIKNHTFSTFYIALVLIVVNASCVSIKQSTVDLSSQVGAQISEMERVHQLAVQRYFDMESEKIKSFMTDKWEPLFLKNFLGTSDILNLLKNVSKIGAADKNELSVAIKQYLVDPAKADEVSEDLVNRLHTRRTGESADIKSALENKVKRDQLDAAIVHVSNLLGTEEAALIIFDFADAAHKTMQQKREELLAPIEQQRLETSAALSQAYADLIRGQSAITGRLEAATRRSKQQDELADKLGIGNITKTVADRMTNFSSVVNNALAKANLALNKVGVGENVLGELSKDLNKKVD